MKSSKTRKLNTFYGSASFMNILICKNKRNDLPILNIRYDVARVLTSVSRATVALLNPFPKKLLFALSSIFVILKYTEFN